MNANIEITTDSNGCATKLLLNGTDISNMVSAVTFRQVGGAMPAVELTFVADCVSIKTPVLRSLSTRRKLRKNMVKQQIQGYLFNKSTKYGERRCA